MNTNDTKTYSGLQTKTQKVKMTRVKCVITILLSLCSIGCIYSYIDYLYGIRALDLISAYISGEYVNQYKLQNGQYYTKNSERVAKTERVTYYNNERIGTANNTKLGIDSTGSNWLRKDIGPIPVGRKISSYEIYGKQWYFDGYNTYSYYENIPRYQQYYDEYGFPTGEVKVIYKKRKRYYSEPIYQQYFFSRCFSTFDISEYVPLFSNEEEVYNKLLDNITLQLKKSYGLTYEEGTIKNYRAIIYDTQDGMPMRRVIFCANKRMYILETKSTHSLSELSYNYCSNLDLTTYDKKKEWYTNVMTPFYGFVVLSFIISLLHFSWKKTGNTNARKFASLNFIMLIICMISLYFCISYEYDIYPAEFPGICSIFTISIFINSLTISELLFKSKKPYETDYLVPQWVKYIIYDSFKKERSKRLYLTFVIYPVVFLISTPLFLFGFIYAIIITIFVKFIMQLCRWIKWINESNTKN